MEKRIKILFILISIVMFLLSGFIPDFKYDLSYPKVDDKVLCKIVEINYDVNVIRK